LMSLIFCIAGEPRDGEVATSCRLRCITWAAESGGILMLAEIAMQKVLNAVGPRA